MRVFWRMVVVAALSLLTGITINQAHPRGIRLRQLQLLFQAAGSDDIQTMPADSALILMFEEKAFFIDIRSRDQYQLDHVPTAISLPFAESSSRDMDRLLQIRSVPWILYDFHESSKRAYVFTRILKKRCQTDVFILEGGFAGWLEREYPIALGKDAR